MEMKKYFLGDGLHLSDAGARMLGVYYEYVNVNQGN